MPSLRSLLSPRGSSSQLTDRPRQTRVIEGPPPLASARLTASPALQADGSFICHLGVLQPDEVDLARENFRKFDADGDGIISRADFGAAMARHDRSWMLPRKAAQLDAMYHAVDVDGTGAVTFEKFCVMRVRKKASKKPAAARMPGGESHPSASFVARMPGGVGAGGGSGVAATDTCGNRLQPGVCAHQVPALAVPSIDTMHPIASASASPRSTNFLAALSQEYYRLHPHDNLWSNSKERLIRDMQW